MTDRIKEVSQQLASVSLDEWLNLELFVPGVREGKLADRLAKVLSELPEFKPSPYKRVVEEM